MTNYSSSIEQLPLNWVSTISHSVNKPTPFEFIELDKVSPLCRIADLPNSTIHHLWLIRESQHVLWVKEYV